jgi:hypothetical protein
MSVIEPIVEAFNRLLSDFTWRRLIALVMFTAYVALFFIVYEATTAQFRLARIEHAANIVARLQEIEAKHLDPTSTLGAVHSDLINRLREVSNPSAVSLPAYAGFYIFLAAAAPWLLMMSMAISNIRKKKPDAWWGFAGVVMLAILAGFTGLIIPTFLWPWGNLVVYPIVLFIVFVVSAGMWQNQKEKLLGSPSDKA